MSTGKRIVIVGGVAGGASAAARARRLSEEAQITLFERSANVSFANCGMPYHIGGTIAQRERLLVQTPEGLRTRFGIDVHVKHEVLRIDRANRQVVVRNGQGEKVWPYDALILSPGAEPIRPKIPGVDDPRVLTLRNLEDMDRIIAVIGVARASRPCVHPGAPGSRPCNSPEEHGQDARATFGGAVIVGGGYVGLEMAEALRQRGLEVMLVELARQVFGAVDAEMAEPLHRQLESHGVKLRLGTSVTAIAERNGQLDVSLSDGQVVAAGVVILAIGVRPEVKLAREAGLAIGPSGGIVVDEHMRTSDPDIFAVGDAVEVTHLVSGASVLIPLAGPANRQGRVAADNALGRPSVYRASQGTAICKVFDLAIGMTGLTEKAAKAAGLAYEKVYVHPASHAGYYPGASQLSLKLLFDPATGKVLGGQAVGADGVDKRIDVLAVAIRAGMTVEDLAELELSYAPPYGSAKDPINYAGFVASNVRSGDMALCHTPDMLNPRQDQLLLDVRTPAEVSAGTIPGSQNIPVDELRARLGELPRDKEILAFCQVGLRGYLACRILDAHGLRCRNLTGGYKTYTATVNMTSKDAAPPELTDDTGAKAPDRVLPPSAASAGRPAAVCCGGAPNQPEAGAVCGAKRACGESAVAKEIDATSLQCPGPILRLKDALAEVDAGSAVAISVSDSAFPADIEAWCHSTGNELLELIPIPGGCRAVIGKRAPAPRAASAGADERAKNKTIVVFSGDFDKAMAAFIIANGAASMGSKVTMFFTFWGINILRRPESVPVKKTLIERMFGRMMPRGAGKLTLSRMNMGGVGTAMIKGIMKNKHVPSLPELIASARQAGVRLVVCSMTMDLMGIKKEELIDGIEMAGVASYLGSAEEAGVNLFV